MDPTLAPGKHPLFKITCFRWWRSIAIIFTRRSKQKARLVKTNKRGEVISGDRKITCNNCSERKFLRAGHLKIRGGMTNRSARNSRLTRSRLLQEDPTCRVCGLANESKKKGGTGGVKKRRCCTASSQRFQFDSMRAGFLPSGTLDSLYLSSVSVLQID